MASCTKLRRSECFVSTVEPGTVEGLQLVRYGWRMEDGLLLTQAKTYTNYTVGVLARESLQSAGAGAACFYVEYQKNNDY